MLQAQLLFNTPALKTYQALTFEEFRGLLQTPMSEADGLIPLGINLLGRSVAFLLAESLPQQMAVRSLFVAPAFRRQGLARELLHALTAYAQTRECPRLSLEYVSERPATVALEAWLVASAWEEPEAAVVLCRVACAKVPEMLQSRWMSDCRLPPEFEIFPWAELSAAEFAQLEQQQAQTPFYEPGHAPTQTDLVQFNSLGLRRRGEVVGWMLTKRHGSDVLYDNLFVKTEYRRLGRGIPLLAEAISLQHQHEGHLPDNHGLWRTLAQNTPMVRFIENHLAPFADEIKRTWVAYKTVV